MRSKLLAKQSFHKLIMVSKKRTQNYKKHIDQVPGTVVYTGQKNRSHLLIESIDYNEDTLKENILASIKEATAYKDTESVSWININGLNFTKEIEAIGKQYHIHPLVLEDIVNTSQRPKIDEFDNYLFIVAKMLYYNEQEEIITEQVSFILGKTYVLTFQESEGDVFDGVRERLRQKKGRIRTKGTDYLLYALMDAIVDQYFIMSETLSNKVEDLETDLFIGNVTESIGSDIQSLKREILKIRRAIFPLREIVNRIEKSEHKLISTPTLSYYRDIYDHIIQLSENIDIYREMIWSLMDMYMTTISNKMNEVMKVLTIIATIFIPLTFIAGVYGMNFTYMPELDYKYSYFILWGVMAVLFVAMLFYFKRKGWL